MKRTIKVLAVPQPYSVPGAQRVHPAVTLTEVGGSPPQVTGRSRGPEYSFATLAEGLLCLASGKVDMLWLRERTTVSAGGAERNLNSEVVITSYSGDMGVNIYPPGISGFRSELEFTADHMTVLPEDLSGGREGEVIELSLELDVGDDNEVF